MSATKELTGRVHLAFATREKANVEKAYNAGLAAGGKDNGAPGDRPYHPGYYAGFLLDPDGNNIEIVFHGPASYSAKSVSITF
jgi:predicted lactoylglutathione lyase